MGARGRQAGNSLSIVQGDVVSIPRVTPSSDLTDEQKREWKTIVAALPSDHFSQENLPLLAEYVRHIITSRRIAHLKNRVDRADKLNLEEYSLLCRMHESESRTLASLATRWRFSQQSRFSARKGRPPSDPKKPWEEGE